MAASFRDVNGATDSGTDARRTIAQVRVPASG